jgi:hypothetical protein
MTALVTICALGALTVHCGGQSPGAEATGGTENAGHAGGGGTRVTNTGGNNGGAGNGASGTMGNSGQAGAAGTGGNDAGASGRGVGGSVGSRDASSAGMGGTRGGGNDGGGVTNGNLMCGSTAVGFNANPFGCQFAWGAAVNRPLSGFSYLQFATTWIETGMKSDGTYSTCGGCNWIRSNFASGNAIPVYYAYIIGYLGHANGITDGNLCPTGQPNCPNLTNQGATLIRNNRDKIVQAYTSYARATYAVWPTKPLVWLLEGDFVQYAGTSQTNPLTMTELAQLASDITCAIKSNMPNAVVAIDQSNWNPDQITNDFWNAMKSVGVPYDMVWTTGVPNNNGYLASGTGPSSYNGKTATYSYVHQLTGKNIWVDDGCGSSGEMWSTSSVSTLNSLIASGVVAFSHCATPSAAFASAVTALEPQLASTCP